MTPALKAYGVSGRARLFEVVQKVNEVNALRQRMVPGRRLNGSSSNATELRENPALALDYITAPPRMAHYITYSTQVYNVYLKYVAPEDIHVYSIDEVFLDATAYLQYNNVTARGFAKMIVQDVLATTGITATAGIGTNLYLCKVAMDIVAKHIEPDADGVRIAKLNERSYRHLLWDHRPLTDFWRVGKGYAKKAMDFIQKYAVDHSYDCIRLTVYNKNQCAIGLYENLGFKKIQNGYWQLKDKVFIGYEKYV